MELVPGPGLTPRLDLENSSIVLIKGRLTARLDGSRISDALVERQKQAGSRKTLSPGDRDFVLPAGHDRNIAQYRSIQHHFPAIYGVGAAGPPDSATDRRRAQAKQLKAYLLFFDQLLANFFAQLAHAGTLFSFFEDDARTYFTQMVDDDDLGLSAVRMFDAPTHLQNLQGIAEDEDSSGSLSSRKHRFLNHLMAVHGLLAGPVRRRRPARARQASVPAALSADQQRPRHRAGYPRTDGRG
jgi:hypothetical protein